VLCFTGHIESSWGPSGTQISKPVGRDYANKMAITDTNTMSDRWNQTSQKRDARATGENPEPHGRKCSD
jgi:hypothetical protein